MPITNKSLKDIAAWHKKKRRLIFAVMLFLSGSLLFSFFFGEMGWMQFLKMKSTLRQNQQEIDVLRNDNNALIKEIDALKTDPLYIERLARERLGLIKKGEVTYEFYPQ